MVNAWPSANLELHVAPGVLRLSGLPYIVKLDSAASGARLLMQLKEACSKLRCETGVGEFFIKCVPSLDGFGVLCTISVHVSPRAEHVCVCVPLRCTVARRMGVYWGSLLDHGSKAAVLSKKPILM